MKIEFIGDFKSLKPIGYEFRKTNSQSQIYYRKNEILIWKKEKEVEIQDFYSKSYVILEFLIKNNFQIKNEFNIIMLNKDTLEVEEYDKHKHNPSMLMFVQKYSDEQIEQFYKTYQKSILSEETIEDIKNLYLNKAVQIVND